MTALEIITDERNGDLDKEMTEILKTRIITLINRINALGDIWFNESWTEEWLSLCAIKSIWFKQLWVDDEWIIIKSIDKEVKEDNIFRNKGENIPTIEVIRLKEQYDSVIKKN
ncbi:MAG: hypothetical protein V4622_02320 [Bacteroidota bacterium]